MKTAVQTGYGFQTRRGHMVALAAPCSDGFQRVWVDGYQAGVLRILGLTDTNVAMCQDSPSISDAKQIPGVPNDMRQGPIEPGVQVVCQFMGTGPLEYLVIAV